MHAEHTLAKHSKWLGRLDSPGAPVDKVHQTLSTKKKVVFTTAETATQNHRVSSHVIVHSSPSEDDAVTICGAQPFHPGHILHSCV